MSFSPLCFSKVQSSIVRRARKRLGFSYNMWRCNWAVSVMIWVRPFTVSHSCLSLGVETELCIDSWIVVCSVLLKHSLIYFYLTLSKNGTHAVGSFFIHFLYDDLFCDILSKVIVMNVCYWNSVFMAACMRRRNITTNEEYRCCTAISSCIESL